MDRTPQLPPSGGQKPTGSPAGAELVFRDVSFAYPSRPQSWVLKDFNLQVCVCVGGGRGGCWSREEHGVALPAATRCGAIGTTPHASMCLSVVLCRGVAHVPQCCMLGFS